VTATVDEPVIRFEGIGAGGELWGGTQANFSIDLPDQNVREVAIIVNAPAAAFLAELAGRDDTEEFREEVANLAGEAWLRLAIPRGERLHSVIFLSPAKLQGEPSVLDELRIRASMPARPVPAGAENEEAPAGISA